MSLSNSSTANWGTIFMGPERMHETTLSRLENTNSSPLWGDDTEVEYFERIKAKATQKAVQILAQAQADADAMLLQAQQQGYEQGLAQAQMELEEFRQAAGDTASAVLSAIEAQSLAITSAWENELTQLVKIAVEAGIGRELSENRAATLSAMFHSAVQELASEQRALVCVNPEDEPVVADIIIAAGQNLSERFQTKADPTLSPGSIILESNFGRLENTLEQRRRMVDKILEELVLSEDSAAKTVEQSSVPNSQASEPSSTSPVEQTEQVSELAVSDIPPTQPDVEEVSEAQPVEVLSEQVTEEVFDQPLDNSAEQSTESSIEEEFVSPLDNLPVEEGSLIPQEILNNQTVQEQTLNTVSNQMTDTPSETAENLLQAEKELAALDDVLEGSTSNQEAEQTQEETVADIDTLLAEEKE